MLLQTHARGVETDGIISAGNFNIKTTAKAFEILSSGIYSNPIHAIVRELSANAYDAHVAAGTTNVPFEITLPSALSPRRRAMIILAPLVWVRRRPSLTPRPFLLRVGLVVIRPSITFMLMTRVFLLSPRFFMKLPMNRAD